MSRSPRYSNIHLTFAVLAVGCSAYGIMQSLVLPVLPTIESHLHTTPAGSAWVITAYLLSASVCTPIMGRFGDMYGKQRLLLVALGALGLGTALAAVSTTLGMMIMARAVQGVGGGVMPLSFGIIRDEFPRHRVTGAVGAAAGLMAVFSGLGTVLAGPILEWLGYGWLFWIPLIAIGGAIVAALVAIPESPVRAPGGINWLGAVLLSGFLVALLVAVSQGATWQWTSLSVLGLLVLSALLGVGWVWSELRSSSPLIDMRMMRIPAVWTTNAVAFLFGVAMYGCIAFLPQFVQAPRSTGYGFGASVTQSGLFLLPMSAGMFVAGMLTGRLAARFGSKSIVVAGALLTAVALALFAFVHNEAWQIYVASGLIGTAVGWVYAATSAIVVEAVPRQQTGVASGVNANLRTIGGSIGASLMASIVAAGVAANRLPSEQAYVRGFAFLMVVAIAAWMVALLIPTATPQRAGIHVELADSGLVDLDAV
jgi:MFS family permease